MQAHERVELSGGRSDDLMHQFAAAMRGDYTKKWDASTDEEKKQWLIRFTDQTERHAIKAFEIGIEYGLQKAKQDA